MAQRWGREVEKERGGNQRRLPGGGVSEACQPGQSGFGRTRQEQDRLPGVLLTSLPIKEQERPLPIKPRMGRALDATRLLPHVGRGDSQPKRRGWENAAQTSRPLHGMVFRCSGTSEAGGWRMCVVCVESELIYFYFSFWWW